METQLQSQLSADDLALISEAPKRARDEKDAVEEEEQRPAKRARLAKEKHLIIFRERSGLVFCSCEVAPEDWPKFREILREALKALSANAFQDLIYVLIKETFELFDVKADSRDKVSAFVSRCDEAVTSLTIEEVEPPVFDGGYASVSCFETGC
jgi:hypothetical protein